MRRVTTGKRGQAGFKWVALVSNSVADSIGQRPRTSRRSSFCEVITECLLARTRGILACTVPGRVPIQPAPSSATRMGPISWLHPRRVGLRWLGPRSEEEGLAPCAAEWHSAVDRRGLTAHRIRARARLSRLLRAEEHCRSRRDISRSSGAKAWNRSLRLPHHGLVAQLRRLGDHVVLGRLPRQPRLRTASAARVRGLRTPVSGIQGHWSSSGRIHCVRSWSGSLVEGLPGAAWCRGCDR